MSLFSKFLSKKFLPDYKGKNQKNSKEKKHGVWIEGPFKHHHSAMGDTVNYEYTFWDEGSYDNGVKVGQWVGYYENNSQILRKQNYVKRKNLSGFEIDYQEIFYPTGELKNVIKIDRVAVINTDYLKNGNITSESTHYVDKKLGSLSKTYNKDGSLEYSSVSKGLIKEVKYYSNEGYLLYHVKKVWKKDKLYSTEKESERIDKKTVLHGSYDDYLKYYGLPGMLYADGSKFEG